MLGASAAASEFCEWVQVGIDVYIPQAKEKILLVSVWVPGWGFFSDDVAGNFFWNNEWIKKNNKEKKKTEKRREKWDQLKKKNA